MTGKAPVDAKPAYFGQGACESSSPERTPAIESQRLRTQAIASDGNPNSLYLDTWSELVFLARAARVPKQAMAHVINAFQHGAIKHGAGKWDAAYESKPDEPYEKAERHIQACLHDSDFDVSNRWDAIDAESGVPHLAKAIANLMILLALTHGESADG